MRLFIFVLEHLYWANSICLQCYRRLSIRAAVDYKKVELAGADVLTAQLPLREIG